MRFRAVVVLAVFAMLFPALAPPATAQPETCADYDAWVWAQTVFDASMTRIAEMDPDGNGIACETLPVVGAFAPVLWADAIPAGAEAVQVTRIIDGDTFDIIDASGNADTVRMYHINAPETSNLGGGPQCGGDSATAFLSTLLSYAPKDTIYLDYDATQRDRFDRRLAYVWYELAGDIYFINEAMVRNGYAESETFEPDVKYRDRLNAAEQWSVEKVTGVRLECGRFGQPPESGPSDEQVKQAWQNQPNQGQLPPYPGLPKPTESSGESPDTPLPVLPTETEVPRVSPTETEVPWIPATQVPTDVPSGECDPSYPGVCIPPVWVHGDLDCGDVPYTWFTVLPPDPHNFDGDFDGYGCER